MIALIEQSKIGVAVSALVVVLGVRVAGVESLVETLLFHRVAVGLVAHHHGELLGSDIVDQISWILPHHLVCQHIWTFLLVAVRHDLDLAVLVGEYLLLEHGLVLVRYAGQVLAWTRVLGENVDFRGMLIVGLRQIDHVFKVAAGIHRVVVIAHDIATVWCLRHSLGVLFEVLAQQLLERRE